MSKIVLEDFNEGNGYYKVNLAYLNKEQVEEIETLVSKWNPTDEDIKNCIGMCLTDSNEQRFKDYNTNLKECLDWLKKQGKKESDPRYKDLEDLLVADDIYQMAMNDAMVAEAKNKAINALQELSVSKILGLKKIETKTLWHPADGDYLPEIDRKVIALLDNGKVVFAHRPQESWRGKNITTGEMETFYPKRYDKGGWNQPNVKWWLDLSLPKE